MSHRQTNQTCNDDTQAAVAKEGLSTSAVVQPQERINREGAEDQEVDVETDQGRVPLVDAHSTEGEHEGQEPAEQGAGNDPPQELPLAAVAVAIGRVVSRLEEVTVGRRVVLAVVDSVLQQCRSHRQACDAKKTQQHRQHQQSAPLRGRGLAQAVLRVVVARIIVVVRCRLALAERKLHRCCAEMSLRAVTGRLARADSDYTNSAAP
mmetsp:Transcript_20216/g.60948  ORF Transcript_20216/g.60948 Transcript_20216/m.60948 type:complete len:207 (+) Transcript_20216:815-1435(+)